MVFINACCGNIADKDGAFSNITRMMKPEARMVISHPLRKSFIHSRSEWKASFPLDDFPEESEAEGLLRPRDDLDYLDRTPSAQWLCEWL